ncbi:MAG TPA: hypothetical protein VF518_08060 [Polyangia bacterium]
MMQSKGARIGEPIDGSRSKAGGELEVISYTVWSLLLIGVGVCLVFGLIGYGHRYAPKAGGWYKGNSGPVELTLVLQDREALACASDLVTDGLACGYHADQHEFLPKPDSLHELRPYATVDQVLLLGAGLWQSPALKGPLPTTRFTVVCNYLPVGAIKSVSLRWKTEAGFTPATQTFPVGRLSDCVIPQ